MFETFIKQGISEALSFLKKKADEQTPEDTGELILNNNILPIVQTGEYMRGRIQNDVSYAPYVEYGVMQKTYNYYKGGGRRLGGKPFYIGVGARMFTKAQFENEAEVREIITRKINEGIKLFNSKKGK